MGLGLVIAALVVNLPFGSYRATARRYSAQWFLAIHLPIPLLFALRVSAGYSYRFIPFLLAGAVAGQLLGSYLFLRWRTRRASVVVPAARARRRV